MKWNWKLPDWPNFVCDFDLVAQEERKFLLSVGGVCAFLKTIDKLDYKSFVVEVLSLEGEESARIEGEFLDRASLQSSIKKHFGLKDSQKERGKEAGMAALLCSVYDSFQEPLSHEMLYKWHLELFRGQSYIDDLGKYRTHKEPMQIVSNRYGSPRVYFEAPSSEQVQAEMDAFIKWFNASEEGSSILGRAAVAHVYFESIHPFEDGNGRIGRLLVEKILSQGVGRPVLIAVSRVLERRKKEYYAALERCNKTLEWQQFLNFFSEVILEAEQESKRLLYFLIRKAELLSSLSGKMNPRQEKVLLRMFAEGVEGFKGGLSAENYIAITKASRATATRDLAGLVEMGALIKKGELRHARYFLDISSYS